jgi:gliding motility-associated-like protein
MRYSIDGIDYSNSTGVFPNLVPGNYSISARSREGCLSPAVFVTLDSPPGMPSPPEVSGAVTYCKNAPSTALSAKGTDLLWYTDPYTGKGSPEAPVPSTATAGLLSFYVSQTILGCESPKARIDVITDFVTIETVNISPNLCYGGGGGSIEILANGSGSSYVYSIDDGLIFQTGNQFDNLSSGAPYAIRVTMDSRCTVSYGAEVTIPQPEAILIDFNLKAPFCETCSNGTLTLSVSGGNGPYEMTLSGMPVDSVIDNIATGTYEVRVTDASGCTAMREIIVNSLDKIPNVITPNGDGVNDLWKIPQMESFPHAIIRVIDMAGKLVFESAAGYPVPWDGRDKGTQLPMGTYYYLINFGPGERQVTGYLTIIR